MSRKLFLLVMLMAPGAVLAKQPEPPLRAGESFQVQQQKVRADIQAGEVYSEISPEDRSQVVAALDRMSEVIGEGNAESLPPEKRLQVFNDQELVNNLLTKARSDSRLICRREKTVGSNLPTTQCATVAQRERMKRDSQRQMEDSMYGNRNPRAGN
jgi:hypothetical protein